MMLKTYWEFGLKVGTECLPRFLALQREVGFSACLNEKLRFVIFYSYLSNFKSGLSTVCANLLSKEKCRSSKIFPSVIHDVTKVFF